jgi:hypothetical protein
LRLHLKFSKRNWKAKREREGTNKGQYHLEVEKGRMIVRRTSKESFDKFKRGMWKRKKKNLHLENKTGFSLVSFSVNDSPVC